MRRLLLPAILAGVALAAVGVYALAASNPQRPMSGHIEISGGPTGESCGADAIRIELAGTGNLAHLGQVQVTASNCASGELETGDAEITDGTSTFTAADGSMITATYSGHQEAPESTVAAYTTTHTVSGGTGRFANATGNWTISGTVDLSIGLLLGDVSGWLRY